MCLVSETRPLVLTFMIDMSSNVLPLPSSLFRNARMNTLSFLMLSKLELSGRYKCSLVPFRTKAYLLGFFVRVKAGCFSTEASESFSFLEVFFRYGLFVKGCSEGCCFDCFFDVATGFSFDVVI